MKTIRKIPGSGTRRMKKFKQEQSHICVYCKIEIPRKEAVSVDHKTSIAQGGLHIEENFAIACLRCNNEKSTMNSEQYKRYVRYKNFLHTLTDVDLEKKDKLFISLLQNKQTSITLRRLLGYKRKALRKVSEERKGYTFEKKMEKKLQKILKELFLIRKRMIKHDRKITMVEIEQLKKEFEKKEDYTKEELLNFFYKIEEFINRTCAHPDIREVHKKKLEGIGETCIYAISGLEMKQ